jgi:hypothetical protein
MLAKTSHFLIFSSGWHPQHLARRRQSSEYALGLQLWARRGLSGPVTITGPLRF